MKLSRRQVLRGAVALPVVAAVTPPITFIPSLPTSTALTTGNFSMVLWPRIQAIFKKDFEEYDPMYHQIFNNVGEKAAAEAPDEL